MSGLDHFNKIINYKIKLDACVTYSYTDNKYKRNS